MLTCIVHNYNRDKYLRKCLESILLQETQYRFEVIVIDDCSTDNSKQEVENIIKEYSSKNKSSPLSKSKYGFYNSDNLHFFSTKKNTGLGKKAIKKLNNQIKPFLKSKYIFRIDSDDYLIDKTKFEKQISFLEHNPVCVGICHHYKIHNEENNSMEIFNHTVVGTFSAFQIIEKYMNNVEYTYNHTSTYLYRNVYQASLPPKFNRSWIYGDVLYNFCMLKYGSICFSDDVMSVYVIHKDGVWSRLSEKRKNLLNSLLPFKIFYVLSIKHKIYFLVIKMKKYLEGKK